MRNSSPRARPCLGTRNASHLNRTSMNTNRQPVPVASNASPRKSISLLQMLALIAFGGIAVSLLLRQFV